MKSQIDNELLVRFVAKGAVGDLIQLQYGEGSVKFTITGKDEESGKVGLKVELEDA